MLRLAFAAACVAGMALAAPSGRAQATRPAVFKGTIKDLLGAKGELILAVKSGSETKDRAFRVNEARIVGLAGAEWKLDDLKKGDRVEVEMTRDGKTVREVRMVGRPKRK